MKDESPGDQVDARVGLIALTVFFLVWSLRATVFYFIDDAISDGFSRSLYSIGVKFVLWVVPALFFVRWQRREPALCYLGLSISPNVREWGLAALATALYMGAVMGLELSLVNKTFHPALPAALSLIFLAASALIEEIFFRGLILHALSEHFRGVSANLMASVLFVSVHWPHWLWSRGFGAGVLADSVGVFFASLLFGWIYLRTRSIWPCFAAHVANNIVAGLLIVSVS